MGSYLPTTLCLFYHLFRYKKQKDDCDNDGEVEVMVTLTGLVTFTDTALLPVLPMPGNLSCAWITKIIICHMNVTQEEPFFLIKDDDVNAVDKIRN